MRALTQVKALPVSQLPGTARRRLARVAQRLAGVLLAVSLVVCGASDASAQWLKNGEQELQRPFVDQEPFDLLFLNQNGENAVLKIKPLKVVPTGGFNRRGEIVFEMMQGFDEKLAAPNSSVEKVKTFNELLIEEADQLIKREEYADAFRNLLFVYDHGGKQDAELVASLKKCMFLDATKNFVDKRFELSLSIYEDLYSVDPDIEVEGIQNKPLIEIILLCYDGIIQQKFDAEEYLTVRKNVEAVVAKYPEDSKQLESRWEKAFLQRSNELLEKSKQFAADSQGRLAHLAARQADQMVSGRQVVLDYQAELLQQFPLILVGVSDPRGDADPGSLDQWGARRVGNFTKRRMLELSGLSDEGGIYTFLNGTFTRMDDAGLKYTLEIQDNTGRFAVPEVNAFEVSMRLLDRGNPESEIYDARWAKIVDRVFIEDERRVTFTLKKPFIRPEALLRMPYDDGATQNGAYILGDESEGIATFELNPMYEPNPDHQNPVIIEQIYDAASSAVDDLIRGNIDVVDRVTTADIARLKEQPNIVVRSYVLPTVHFMVPKIRHEELKDDLNFRSGLSYSINREQIVRDVLCGGQVISGSEPVSGPFPLGTDTHDQIAYGYDSRAKPLVFNEKLGMAFMELALQPNPPDRPEALERPSLVIAHPGSSASTNAAQAIARSWSQAGIITTTRKLKPGQSIPEDADWDFLYMEVSIEEPLADAGLLIGRQGFAKDVSAPIEQTLRILNYSRSWQTACSALRRLHRQVRVDLSIIPLWQVTENYAYRNTIRNVGRDIIHLYQNVDRWKIDLKAEEEQE